MERIMVPAKWSKRMANRLMALVLLAISPLAFVAVVAMAAFRLCGVNWFWVKSFPADEWSLVRIVFTGEPL